MDEKAISVAIARARERAAMLRRSLGPRSIQIILWIEQRRELWALAIPPPTRGVILNKNKNGKLKIELIGETPIVLIGLRKTPVDVIGKKTIIFQKVEN